jgi:GNAT acetyltransferase-like protein
MSEQRREWGLGPYRPGDEREILDLFNAGFGQQRSLATWNWRFQCNPSGGPFASLARRISDGMLVGTCMCLPFKLGADGTPVLAFQIVDLVVHPEYRRQGMFEQMARYSYRMLAEVGGRAVVAFPNPTATSYPGFTRTLGWKTLCALRRFTFRLDLERPLRTLVPIPGIAGALNSGFRVVHSWRLERRLRRLVRSSSNTLEFRLSREAPPGCDALWDACRTQQRLSFWKDAEYFRWRYDRNPDHDFAYAGLMRDGELIALSVVLERDRAITLCELLVAEQDVIVGRRLIAEICRMYLGARMRSVSYLGHDAGFHARVLKGFSIGSVTENVLLGRALEDDALEALMGESDHWSVTYGDADFV